MVASKKAIVVELVFYCKLAIASYAVVVGSELDPVLIEEERRHEGPFSTLEPDITERQLVVVVAEHTTVVV